MTNVQNVTDRRMGSETAHSSPFFRVRHCWILVSAALVSGQFRSINAAPVDFPNTILPLLKEHCFACHSGEKPKGELDLSAFTSESRIMAERPLWNKVHDAIRDAEMPPQGKPQFASEDRLKIIHWIMEILKRPDENGLINPGHVALRRLNFIEYNNTVQDLFGDHRSYEHFNPEKGMPEEIRTVPFCDRRKIIAALPPDDIGHGFDNLGEVLSLPPFLMEKYLSAARKVIEQIGTGRQVQAILNRTRRSADSSERARRFITEFLKLAFRRPPETDEVDRFFALYKLATDRGEPLEKALQVPLEAMLVSPHFLFKVEHGNAKTGKDGIRPLTDYELATRLSYFLWSTMPDRELFHFADRGQLTQSAILEKQTRRMLRHRYAHELAERFGLQWLKVENIRSAMPDPERFPRFYKLKYLPHQMRLEVLYFFETMIAEDRSVLEFIDADWTWATPLMADFYGFEPGRARERNSIMYWKRYALPDRNRGGVLTMAGPLMATSMTTRTSPVLRGKWILETIFNNPPPPPLPNVPDLDDTPVAADTATLRERLEAHRADPACSACHALLDPVGFGLENFNAIGEWRDRDGTQAIDAKGTMTDGSSFNGPAEMKKLFIDTRCDDFLRGLTEQMMIYALGRPIEYYDAAAVEQIVTDLKRDEFRFSTLIVGIVKSYPFRYLKVTQKAE